jgi:hypothetical protein
VTDLKRRILAHTPTLIRDVTYKDHEYKQVMIGSELVDWLIVTKAADTRPNAVRMASQVIIAYHNHLSLAINLHTNSI